ncbi:hypothetical protein BH20ACT8_BH20ACT8_10170 [soil metagenome]
MTTIEQVQDGTARVDGAELYYERRGAGPAVLCVTGASGDAGVLASLADRLAGAYPGAHTPYFDQPDAFAATVRSCLCDLAAVAALAYPTSVSTELTT